MEVLHLTDLHYHAHFSSKFLKKIALQCTQLKPDLILFTGDFICCSRLENELPLQKFLAQLQAPLGSFCSLGNHDYAHYVTLNHEGIYDVSKPIMPLKGVLIGLKTLFSASILKKGIRHTEPVQKIPVHHTLCELLKQTPFQLLDNQTQTLPIGLNITGLGDLALARCDPQTAFQNYNKKLPGIILSHNPDTIPMLLDYPGNWILCGHTHGEQIHLPWPKWGRKLTQKLARLENSAYTRGLIQVKEKTIYVNRGLGCHKPFRLFSPPELCLIQLKK